MSTPSTSPSDTQVSLRGLAGFLLEMPPALRGAAMQCAVSFRPSSTLESSFAIGPLRAAFANYWEERFGQPVPMQQLRRTLEPPVPIKTVLEFCKLNIASDFADIESALSQLVKHLSDRIRELNGSAQLGLFQRNPQEPVEPVGNGQPDRRSVRDLYELLRQGCKFPTVYADPPWPYDNEASRAAAVNHYPVMSVEQICAEPVEQLVAENAHLHLWTTNAFLRDAFDVIEAWGFCFKSCLVWIKPEIGMGNYWRVSHEFLLLGVRGRMTFRDRTKRSWVEAQRLEHSRKPGIVRSLIEKVSLGPYLELYGRHQLPDSDWTVYGNQIERRLF